MRRVPVLLAVAFAMALFFVITPAMAQITVDFFSGGNASAGWVTITPAPPGDPDDQSIALEVNGDSGSDFDDFAGAELVGVDDTLPAAAPSFDFQSNVSDAGSGGSPRLVICFVDLTCGSRAELRPLSWTAGAWVTIDGNSNQWDNSGGSCGFLFGTNYATVTTCHVGESVTAVFVVSDSGWFHPGGYIHYIDNISYDGEVITAPPTPPECSDGEDNDGDGLIDFDGGPEGGEPDPGCEGPDDFHEANAPGTTCSEDENEDGTTRSTITPEEDETGLASSIIYKVDKSLLYPIPIISGEGGVVANVDCTIVTAIEELLGLD